MLGDVHVVYRSVKSWKPGVSGKNGEDEGRESAGKCSYDFFGKGLGLGARWGRIVDGLARYRSTKSFGELRKELFNCFHGQEHFSASWEIDKLKPLIELTGIFINGINNNGWEARSSVIFPLTGRLCPVSHLDSDHSFSLRQDYSLTVSLPNTRLFWNLRDMI